MRSHPCTFLGLAGEGATTGLLYVTDQDYLGHGPSERGKGGGLLPWNGDRGCHR